MYCFVVVCFIATKDFESKAEELKPVITIKPESVKPFGPTVIIRSDLQRVKSDSQFDKFAELPKAKPETRLNVTSSDDKQQSSAPNSRPGSSASSPIHDASSTPKKDGGGGLAPESVTSIPKSASKAKLQDQLDLKKEYDKRRAEKGKDHINMVVVGGCSVTVKLLLILLRAGVPIGMYYFSAV